MRNGRSTWLETRMATLRRRPYRHCWVVGVVGWALVVGIGIAATTSRSVPAVIQAKRLEVVNEAGQVVFVARVTVDGGRVEVVNDAGLTVFSTGADRAGTEPLGLWEHMRRKVARLRQDVTHQRRQLEALTQQVQAVRRQRQKADAMIDQRREVDQQRRDIAQQRRALDALQRQLQHLSRHLRDVEHR
jgi:uncharacterized coiled-coil protein SlyX